MRLQVTPGGGPSRALDHELLDLGSLSAGRIIGDMAECCFHGGAFDIHAGTVEAPPCMDPLRTCAV